MSNPLMNNGESEPAMRTPRIAVLWTVILAFVVSLVGAMPVANAQDEPKKEEPKAAVKDEPKKEEPKKEEPKPEPKKEEPKTEPKKEDPKPEPKPEPKKPAPKKEDPKPEPKKPESKPEPKKPEPKKPEPKPEPKKPEPKPEPKKPEPKPEPKVEDLKSTTVVINLDNPTGVAVHSSGQVFIASHDGIHRFQPKTNTCPLAISGFDTDVYGKGPKYNIGPLGLAFLNDTTLVVGDGSKPDGEELVRVYSIPAEHPGTYAKADTAAYTFGPIEAGDKSARGEGNYYGVAIVNDEIFVTNNGDDTKGWISRVVAKDGDWKESKLEPFIATKEAVGVDAPVPVSVNTDNQLVVGQMGEVNAPGDSLLTIYNPKDGKLIAKGAMDGLHDVAGLAYSEKTKKWYATDFAWVKPEEGALYELSVEPGKAGDDGVLPLTVKKTKLMSLDKPTDLAFDADGNLYIAVFGTGKEGADTSPGRLIKVEAADLK